MKKVFFAAAFAVVAIAGAFATNSKKAVQTGNFYSDNATVSDIPCNSGPQLCSVYNPDGAWDKPANDPTRQLVDLTQYEHPIQ